VVVQTLARPLTGLFQGGALYRLPDKDALHVALLPVPLRLPRGAGVAGGQLLLPAADLLEDVTVLMHEGKQGLAQGVFENVEGLRAV